MNGDNASAWRGPLARPEDSYFREVERRAREKLLRRDLARRQPLLVVIAHEGLERVPVRFETVTPIVAPHEAPRVLEFRYAPRQAHEEMPDLPELVHGELL